MDGDGRERQDVLSDLSELYDTFHEDIKHYYRRNEASSVVSPDIETQERLFGILERTDDLCTSLENGDIDTAVERYEQLADEMRETLGRAACYGAEQQLDELDRRLFEYRFVYTLGGFDVPDISECQQTKERMRVVLDEARTLDSTDYEACVRKCDRVWQNTEPLVAELPSRNAVFVRSITLIAAAVTIGTALAAFVTGVVSL